MGVLNNIELEQVINLYEKNSIKKEENEYYQKYAKVLKDLKDIGYLTEEEYKLRINKLKAHF